MSVHDICKAVTTDRVFVFKGTNKTQNKHTVVFSSERTSYSNPTISGSKLVALILSILIIIGTFAAYEGTV